MNYQIDPTKAIYDVIDNDIVIINLDNGNYYNLTSVSVLIWKNLIKGATEQKILDSIESEYDVKLNKAKNDLSAFLKNLLTEKLIINADESTIVGDDSQPNKEAIKQEYSPPELETFSDMQDFLLVDPIHEVDENGLPKFTPPSME